MPHYIGLGSTGIGVAAGQDCTVVPGTATDWNVLKLTYGYGASNNGNVLSQEINAAGTVFSQSYTYDGVNRLRTFSETGMPGQTYVYDRYGNRAVLGSSYLPNSPATPQVLQDVAAQVEQIFPNNQSAGATPDAAGNQTAAPGRAYSFDGENRMRTSSAAEGMGSTRLKVRYDYDGEGRRVKTVACTGLTDAEACTETTTGAVITTFVYDAMGQLAAEYGSATGGVSGPSYVTADHLGSTRVVTDANGARVKCYDYLPFGEELAQGVNGRPACYPTAIYPTTVPDAVRQKFTGKERDGETGLDYFGARYFSGAQGRFTSVDPSGLSTDTANPQSWNRYAYTYNNPLRYVDPNGKWPTEIHNAILATAFTGLAGSQVAVLQAASARVDSFWYGGQTAELAHQHGMRSPYESAGKARSDADKFIASNEQAASAEATKAGSVDDAALSSLGTALHTVMDRTSPAHAGEQVWTGGGEPGATSAAGPIGVVIGAGIDAVRAKIHSDKEKQITLDQYHKSVDAVRKEYLKTFGQDAFYRATGCKQVKGCAYDDSKLPDDLRKDR